LLGGPSWGDVVMGATHVTTSLFWFKRFWETVARSSLFGGGPLLALVLWWSASFARLKIFSFYFPQSWGILG